MLDGISILLPLLLEMKGMVIEEDLLLLQVLFFLFGLQLCPAQISRLLLVLWFTDKQSLMIISLNKLVHDPVLFIDDFRPEVNEIVDEDILLHDLGDFRA